jgi:hypothetical protein
MKKDIEAIYHFTLLYEQSMVYVGYTDADGYPAIKVAHFTMANNGIMTIAKDDIKSITGTMRIYVDPDNYPQMILSDKSDYDRFDCIDANQLAYFKGYFVK